MKIVRAVNGFLQGLGVAGVVAIIGLWLAILYGWIANIYKLFAHAPAIAQWGVEQVVRIVGIPVWFIGAVAGYF